MYSLRCTQCGSGFLSSYNLEAPICGKCLQKAKSLDSTIDYDKVCTKCGKNGVIYGKTMLFLLFWIWKEWRDSKIVDMAFAAILKVKSYNQI
jgi:hypothetical protein